MLSSSYLTEHSDCFIDMFKGVSLGKVIISASYLLSSETQYQNMILEIFKTDFGTIAVNLQLRMWIYIFVFLQFVESHIC